VPLHRGRRSAVRNDRASTSITINGTTWVNVDTVLDLVLTMSAGQWASIGVTALWGNEPTAGDLDAATVVAGNPVNYISGGTGQTTDRGVMAWGGENAVFTHVGSAVAYQAAAGDVVDGQVRFRLRAHATAATNKTLFATAAVRLSFYGWVIG
jgi:hypothetical protein